MTDDFVTVAPREITDYVARASRVAGCSASVADDVATDVTYCEVHHGSGIGAFVALLDGAPNRLNDLAVEAMTPGNDTPFLFRCRLGLATDDTSVAARQFASATALSQGLSVDAKAWNTVVSFAADFLLSESILDAS